MNNWILIKKNKVREIYNKTGTHKILIIDKTLTFNWLVSIGISSNLKQVESSYRGAKLLGHWRYYSTAKKNALLYMKRY